MSSVYHKLFFQEMFVGTDNIARMGDKNRHPFIDSGCECIDGRKIDLSAQCFIDIVG